jgi:hypothetical protein
LFRGATTKVDQPTSAFINSEIVHWYIACEDLATFEQTIFKGGFMKKEFAALTLALGLGAATSPGLAEPTKTTDISFQAAASSGPVKMTDDQMDNVTAGLITVIAVDVVDVNNNNILNDAQLLNNIAVSANAAIAVLGNAVAQGMFVNQQEVTR